MRTKDYILTLVLAATMMITATVETTAQTERLTYAVSYNLGFLKKHMGDAHITLRFCSEGRFFATMNGHSIAWGGRVYTISDTLRADMEPGRGIVGITERVNHCIGWYSKPYERELRDGSYTLSDPAYYKTTAGGGSLDASDETMEAVGVTADMLGLFWFFRNMDFSRLRKDVAYVVPVFGPKGNDPVQHFRLTYHGHGTCKCDGRCVEVERVTFEYYHHGSPSGYPVECCIDRSTGIPLSFSAALKIGHFRMTLKTPVRQ